MRNYANFAAIWAHHSAAATTHEDPRGSDRRFRSVRTVPGVSSGACINHSYSNHWNACPFRLNAPFPQQSIIVVSSNPPDVEAATCNRTNHSRYLHSRPKSRLHTEHARTAFERTTHWSRTWRKLRVPDVLMLTPPSKSSRSTSRTIKTLWSIRTTTFAIPHAVSTNDRRLARSALQPMLKRNGICSTNGQRIQPICA